jgi:glycosyltransferase involved in cell wall biosynthesis
LHIAFVDFVSWDYTIQTAYEKPLGGSQSALCYLAEELAARGHEVQLVNNTTQPGVSRGVACLPLSKATADVWKRFDVVILLNSVKPGLSIRPMLNTSARLIGWIQHAHDQPAVQPLARAEVRGAFDNISLVSDWQREKFERSFSLDPPQVRVMRNAIAPAFRDLFPPGANIVGTKTKPPVLAYTSTPFRGLDLLVHSFPAIRKQASGTVLRVYSSMHVYQANDENDEAQFGRLYDLCRETPGVEYIGLLSQPDLATQLREATMLAYPNHFAETSCIAALEAMASGCLIATSDLGALRETTAGFARLVPVGDDWLAYCDRFVDEVVKALEEIEKQPDTVNERLARQVAHVNAEYTWSRRADEWEQWLGAAKTAPTGLRPPAQG